jgi:hypothetical protein
VIGIELLAAAQGCDFHAPLASSDALEAARALLRREVPISTMTGISTPIWKPRRDGPLRRAGARRGDLPGVA